jgi:hypothetical protein
MPFVIELIHTTVIASKTVQLVIFQNNLNERDIIFANIHIISKIHKNIETIISPPLIKNNNV